MMGIQFRGRAFGCHVHSSGFHPQHHIKQMWHRTHTHRQTGRHTHPSREVYRQAAQSSNASCLNFIQSWNTFKQWSSLAEGLRKDGDCSHEQLHTTNCKPQKEFLLGAEKSTQCQSRSKPGLPDALFHYYLIAFLPSRLSHSINTLPEYMKESWEMKNEN